MLVLARKRNESIIIGQPGKEITIMVVEIRGGVVRLGIEAPREVSIVRSEISTRGNTKNPGKI